MKTTTIAVDRFEVESGIPAELRRRGTEITVRRLPVADYAIGPALVERKSVRDLHLSIITGRLWPQLGRLRRATRFPYLLIEGRNLDAGPLSGGSTRGACLATCELGVMLIRSSDPPDSAQWLALLAARVARTGFARDRPAYAQRPKSSRGTSGEAMLAATPGISTIHARRLLKRFGTVAAIAAADPAEWLSVPGIGATRAAALAAALGLDRRSN